MRLTNTDALGYDDFSSTTTISYPSANIMFITDSYNSQTYTCTLNNDGYIVSLTEGGNEVESLAYTNGYLQKKMMYRSDDDGITLHAGTYTETYTWNNGNVKIIERECNYPTAPELNWSYTSTYEYSAVQNKLSSIDLSRNSFQPLGWYGKPDLNLMSKITDENPWDEDVRTYRYETDQDGYVTNIFVRYNGGSEELMATIQY
ncbi:MAG: hypothetical protein FWH39_02295 [Bacteroidales bacterium]|nr:hypothetical protein [Bacteroidales bacterium]